MRRALAGRNGIMSVDLDKFRQRQDNCGSPHKKGVGWCSAGQPSHCHAFLLNWSLTRAPVIASRMLKTPPNLMAFAVGRLSLSEDEKDRFAGSLLRHLDALYGFAWWLTHRREEIEDLVQETLLRALRCAHQFESGTNLKAWLFSILKHEWFRRAGLARREVSGDSFSDNPEGPGREWAIETDVIRSALQKDLDEALRTLPEEYRSAVLLFDLYGFSLKETAEILAVPDGTVKSRLSRGHQMLRGRLQAYSRVPDNDEL